MRIIFYILIVLVSSGCSQSLDKKHPLYTDSKNVKTEYHKRIKGTKLFAVVPDHFVFNEQSKKYSTKNQFIKFVKLPNVSWSDIQKKSTSNSIPLYGYNGTYFESEDLKHKRIDILIQFGGDDFVFHVNAKTSTEIENGRTEILNVLQSLYYDEKYELDKLELANFTIDKTFTEYDQLIGSDKYYSYTKGENSISFHDLRMMISDQNLDEEINNLLAAQLKLGMRFKNRTIVNHKVGVNDVRIIESEFESNTNSGLCCLAVINDSEIAIAITAIGYEDTEKLSSHFSSIIESLRFKNGR